MTDVLREGILQRVRGGEKGGFRGECRGRFIGLILDGRKRRQGWMSRRLLGLTWWEVDRIEGECG